MFLVFTGDQYYPGGGWRDFVGFALTLEAAEALALQKNHDWYHIVGPAFTIVKSGHRGRDY